IRHVAPAEMRRKREYGLGWRRVLFDQYLAWLAGLHTRGRQLIEWHRPKDADTSAPAERKDAAADYIKVKRVADRLLVVVAPGALRRDFERDVDAAPNDVQREGQGGAASRRHGRVGGRIIDAQRKIESRRREIRKRDEGAVIACRREQALALQ